MRRGKSGKEVKWLLEQFNSDIPNGRLGSDVSLLFEQFILKAPPVRYGGKLGREVNWLLEQFNEVIFGGKFVIYVNWLLEQFNEVIWINFDKSGNSVKPLLDKSSSDTHFEIVKDSILTVLGCYFIYHL